MIPSHEIMEQLSTMAIEQATIMLAEQARTFANSPMVNRLNSKDALNLFADAIISNNAKMFPVKQEGKQ